MIKVDSRTALITKVYSKYAWQLKFIDNGEIINVFYHNEYDWSLATPSRNNN